MSPTQPGAPAPLIIPRIVPPQGERTALHGQPSPALPLEPSLIPSPPVTPESIPRMPRPIAKTAPSRPVPPPYTVGGDETYPAAGPLEDQVLWCLARFPRAEVDANWAAAAGADYARIVARFDQETAAYGAALLAYEQAQQAQPEAPTPTPAVAQAPAAQVVVSPPQPEVKTLPLGSTVVFTPTPIQQPQSLALGARWAHADGQELRIVGFGPEQHNPHDQIVELRGANGSGVQTQVKFLLSSSTGYRFLGPPEVQASAPPSTPEPDAAALAAVHHDAPAIAAGQPQPDGQGAASRRLTAKARLSVLERWAAGKDKLVIAQETGLPMELVERAIASAPPPAAQSQAAEKAYQQTLTQGGSEEQARRAGAEAIAAVITAVERGAKPEPLDIIGATARLAQGLSAYEDASDAREGLLEMRSDLDTLLRALEGC